MGFLWIETPNVGEIVISLSTINWDLALLIDDKDNMVKPDPTGSTKDVTNSWFQVCEFLENKSIIHFSEENLPFVIAYDCNSEILEDIVSRDLSVNLIFESIVNFACE